MRTRVAIVALILLPLAAMAQARQTSALLSPLGVYRLDVGSMWLTIKIIPGAPRAEFVGVILDSNVDAGREHIGEVVVELNTGPGGRFVGRFNAGHVGYASWGEWWPLEDGGFNPQITPVPPLTYFAVSAAGKSVVTYFRRHLDVHEPPGAPEPTIVGRYKFDCGSASATIEITAGGPLYDFVGVVVGGSGGFQMGDVALQLNKIGVNSYYGRYGLRPACQGDGPYPWGIVNQGTFLDQSSMRVLRIESLVATGPGVLIYRPLQDNLARRGGAAGSGASGATSGGGGRGGTSAGAAAGTGGRAGGGPGSGGGAGGAGGGPGGGAAAAGGSAAAPGGFPRVASGLTGFESKNATEKTIQEPPANAAASTRNPTPPGPGKTGFESKNPSEQTVQPNTTQPANTNQGGVPLAGVNAAEQSRPQGTGSVSRVAPAATPADRGELEGDWFMCGLNRPEYLARCLGIGGTATTGLYGTLAAQIVRFTKNGNQYDGRLAPGSGVGQYSATGWYSLYHPGDPRFRLTRTSSTQYEGQEFRCYYPPGFDPELNRGTSCQWGGGLERTIVTVQGDHMVAESRPYSGELATLYVRPKGQVRVQQGPATTDCVAKYCPACTQSVNLIGATPPECDACKNRNASLIAQCNQQGSATGPGHDDTRGLPDTPVYCAYEVPQPNFNPNVRYETGKCDDVHPVDYRKIYGPETFLHCREWLTKMGLAR